MTIQVPVRLTDSDVAALDQAVAEGRFKSRSHALREGLANVLREAREQEIEDAYRRGYGEHPQESWIGEAGLAAFDVFDRSEGGDLL
jgi:Arc/MetJ-type ribon-helix-helix transcriptional regulator